MDNTLTVKEALPSFYKQYQLDADGGVNDNTVKIKLFKGVYVYIPNVEARKKVVLKHDMHHLVTGYTGVMKGETEISAWEISTGCSNNMAAFVINTLGMMMGVLFNLRGIWKAWYRGRYTRNLYYVKYTEDELLGRTIQSLQEELGLLNNPKQMPGRGKAFLLFAGFLLFGTIISIISLALSPLILLYSLYIFLSRKLWKKN
ncbi:MAG: hypothetical protein ACHQF2_04595 [Flavobacteriales bacterium]